MLCFLQLTFVFMLSAFCDCCSLVKRQNLKSKEFATSFVFLNLKANDVNILGGSIHTLKENAEALVAAYI